MISNILLPTHFIRSFWRLIHQNKEVNEEREDEGQTNKRPSAGHRRRDFSLTRKAKSGREDPPSRPKECSSQTLTMKKLVRVQCQSTSRGEIQTKLQENKRKCQEKVANVHCLTMFTLSIENQY